MPNWRAVRRNQLLNLMNGHEIITERLLGRIILDVSTLDLGTVAILTLEGYVGFVIIVTYVRHVAFGVSNHVGRVCLKRLPS